MHSIAWSGDIWIPQPYGCTDLIVEPPFPDCASGHKHCGIDVATNLGTPLFAAEDSTVSYIGPALLALVSAHGCWWYVHIDRVASGIVLGKHLTRGQLACYSGNKVPSGGASTGPHTHIELQNARRALLAYYDANGRLVRPPGSLNNPYTCLDPVPILSLRFSSGGGEIPAPPPAPAKPKPPRRTTIVATTKSLHAFCRGNGPAFNLYHRRRDASGVWTAWKSLGGKLGPSGISVGVDPKGALVVSVEGMAADGTGDGRYYDTTSADDGLTWSAFADNGAGGDSLTMQAVLVPDPAVTLPPPVLESAPPVDLGPVLAAAEGAKSAAEAAKANTDELMGLLPGR